MIDFKKPGTGIKPNKIEKYFGKRIRKNIKLNEVLKTNHF